MTLLTIVLSALVIATVFAVRAIGVMFGRPPLKGSCGGIGASGVEGGCDICGGSPERCEEANAGTGSVGVR